jgi:hypothetical protein
MYAIFVTLNSKDLALKKRVSKFTQKSFMSLTPGWEGTAGSNASVTMKEKSIITLTPGVNIIKLFSFIADDEAK